MAHDVVDGVLPGIEHAHGAYWHEPTSIEAYYGAQMDLCGQRPGLDLFNPAWPLPAAPTQFGPSKVGLDEAGRPGQTLSCLVADGALVRGVVANSVVGRGVIVESGAEVQDCVLLDGCHVGRYARVRRAVVGAGAVIPDGAEIGYGATPPWALERAVGATLVAPTTTRGSASRAGGSSRAPRWGRGATRRPRAGHERAGFRAENLARALSSAVRAGILGGSSGHGPSRARVPGRSTEALPAWTRPASRSSAPASTT